MQENKEERIMKQIKLEINIEACHYDELTEKDRKLIAAVAAVLLEYDIVITGTIQDHAAYPSGLCAERTTLFYANSQYPDQAVKTLAIAARTENGFLDTPIPPCGACRQVLLETEKRYGKPMRILLYSKTDIYILENVSGLLPLSFDGNYLK